MLHVTPLHAAVIGSIVAAVNAHIICMYCKQQSYMHISVTAPHVMQATNLQVSPDILKQQQQVCAPRTNEAYRYGMQQGLISQE